MRALLILLLLAACTVPPDVPVKESPVLEKGVAEAPPKPPPPAPKPHRPANGITIKAAPLPEAPAPPPCPPLSENKKIQILQKLDCLIIIEQVKP